MALARSGPFEVHAHLARDFTGGTPVPLSMSHYPLARCFAASQTKTENRLEPFPILS